MIVYIVMENPDAFGGTPKEPNGLVHAAFFDRGRAEDFVCGMARYISSYDSPKLSVEAGKAQDEEGDIYFAVVPVEVTGKPE